MSHCSLPAKFATNFLRRAVTDVIHLEWRWLGITYDQLLENDLNDHITILCGSVYHKKQPKTKSKKKKTQPNLPKHWCFKTYLRSSPRGSASSTRSALCQELCGLLLIQTLQELGQHAPSISIFTTWYFFGKKNWDTKIYKHDFPDVN